MHCEAVHQLLIIYLVCSHNYIAFDLLKHLHNAIFGLYAWLYVDFTGIRNNIHTFSITTGTIPLNPKHVLPLETGHSLFPSPRIGNKQTLLSEGGTGTSKTSAVADASIRAPIPISSPKVLFTTTSNWLPLGEIWANDDLTTAKLLGCLLVQHTRRFCAPGDQNFAYVQEMRCRTVVAAFER